MATYAIGDIHGCLTALDALLDRVGPTDDDKLVLLGDYVDRGPDSKGVLDRVIDLRERGAIPLVGNHELMMRDARDDWHSERTWRSVGGQAALDSYAPDASVKQVPRHHWRLLDELLAYHETSTHIFVHASYSPRLPMAAQSPLMLCWERLSFDHPPHVSGKTVICGHTRQEEGLPLDLGHQVCIDTSAYAGGWLTCLDVDSGRFWQAEDSAGNTRSGSLEALRRGEYPV